MCHFIDVWESQNQTFSKYEVFISILLLVLIKVQTLTLIRLPAQSIRLFICTVFPCWLSQVFRALKSLFAHGSESDKGVRSIHHISVPPSLIESSCPLSSLYSPPAISASFWNFGPMARNVSSQSVWSETVLLRLDKEVQRLPFPSYS